MEKFLFVLLFFAPFAVAGLIKLIYDFATSDVKYNARKLEKIRQRILVSLRKSGFETSVDEGNDFVKYRDTNWRFSVLNNKYGSATIWIDACLALDTSYPNISADGIRLAAAYAASENPTINVIMRNSSATYCVAIFHYDSTNGDGFISALNETDEALSSYFGAFNKLIASLDDSYLTDRQKRQKKVGFHQSTRSEEATIVAQANEGNADRTDELK